ncbi:MAG: hypothetical protein DRG24_01815 [Epsilonproteobacteria bacterium]|nr:MAG: hypothetical protein DRG24_01815 [Campylobacterota bacterium]
MNIEPFNELSRTLIDEINTYGRLVTFEKSHPCMQGDDLLEYFYIIVSGRMKVYDINLDNAREQTLFLLTRGDMFDMVTLLDGRSHDVMTEAIDKVSAIELPMEKARLWLETNKRETTAYSSKIALEMQLKLHSWRAFLSIILKVKSKRLNK